MKYLLTIIFAILIPVQPCLAQKNNFITGIEFGPFYREPQSLPLTAISKDLNNHKFDYLSLWLKMGYRFKRFAVLVDFGSAGEDYVGIVPDTPPFNTSDISLYSITINAGIHPFRRTNIKATIGVRHSFFKAFTVNDEKPSFKYSDTGKLLGFSVEYDFLENIQHDKAFIGLSYNWTSITHFTDELIITIGVSSENKVGGYVNFRYVNQQNIYDFYSFTAGFEKYFDLIKLLNRIV